MLAVKIALGLGFSLSVPYAQENDPNAFLIFVRAGSKGNIEKFSEIVVYQLLKRSLMEIISFTGLVGWP